MVPYESLKTKEKSSSVISKAVAVVYGSGCLQELFITKFKSHEFCKGGPNNSWSLTRVVAKRASTVFY